MTHQEKKDSIIKALYKNLRLDFGTASSMGINNIIKVEGNSLPDQEIKILGTTR